MGELLFLKLGGSLITDKEREATARQDTIRRIAREVRRALGAKPGLKLLLGHGSGSFGHFVGQKYGTRQGANDERGWRGYSETGASAARLNRLVTDIFLDEGVPVVSLQPSASACCRDGEIIFLETYPIEEALAHGLIPLVYGDVAFDKVRGCTIISTEEIFAHLAVRLRPGRIILAGIVEGVFTADPLRHSKATLISKITSEEVDKMEKLLNGSHGIDVTGGMLAKVRLMAKVVRAQPELTVQLISGSTPGHIAEILIHPEFGGGTIIRA